MSRLSLVGVVLLFSVVQLALLAPLAPPARANTQAGGWVLDGTPGLAVGVTGNSATLDQCADDITVQNNGDSGAGSLRQAIADVCAGGTITFNNNYTITVGSALTIGKELTIDGETHQVGIDGGGKHQVFIVTTYATTTLTALTIAHGYSDGNGGAIYNSAILKLSHVILEHNTAAADGGAIFNGGGSVLVRDSTLNGNTAVNGCGGGLSSNEGEALVWATTFMGNQARCGGGVSTAAGDVLIVVSTFNGNTATDGNGGALYGKLQVQADIKHSTVAGNTATGSGGGIYLESQEILWLKNTILADNPGGDCFAENSAVSASNNLIRDAVNTCGLVNGTDGNLIGVDPKLGLLADNGGPTKTMALLGGSPAMNAGDKDVCSGGDLFEPIDQRGVSRPHDAPCDLGAFEASFITGQKFDDRNGNGARDNGEPGLPGWTIQLQDPSRNNTVLDSATTDASGNYTLTIAALPFTYRVREVAQTGWTQTTQDPSDQNLTLENPGAEDLVFGNVYNADMGIVKTYKFNKDGSVTFEVKVTNAGPGKAKQVVVTDALPDLWQYGSASASQGTCAPANNKLTCKLGAMKAGATATVTINLLPLKSTNSFTNCAEVTSRTYDPNPDNHTSCVTKP